MTRLLCADANAALLNERETAPSKRGDSHRRSVALVGHEIRTHGGMDRAVTELLVRASNEIEFHVLSAELAEPLRPLVRWHRLRVPRRPFPVRYVAFYIVAGLRLRRLRVDLIHTLGAIVPNRIDIATVHACHAGFVRATNRLSPAGAPLSRRVNTSVSRVLSLMAERWTYRPARVRILAAVSGGVLHELERDYPRARVTVTPNGVDLDRFRPDVDARVDLRSAEGLDDDVRVVLFVGGNWDHKGLPIAIEAIARARAMGAPIDRLWVVGEGDMQRFRYVAARHGVADRVTFFGARADVERFYQAADIFVLPSAYEAFSLVLLEAAASGLPIITAAVNGVEELSSVGQALLVVDRTPAAFAQALAVLCEDSEHMMDVGRNARASAITYTWERSVRRVVRVYCELLGERVPVKA
jgi:glycosyltransferase involved in cell wall biosynthesis